MSRKFQRNVEGLCVHAKLKAEKTRRRAEEAIAQLLKEQRPINFKSVAETAGISTSWLYGNDALRERITHLRERQVPRVQVKIPSREQASSASKDTMIVALRQRIQKLDQENRDLRRQVEVANGLLYQHEGGEPRQ